MLLEVDKTQDQILKTWLDWTPGPSDFTTKIYHIRKGEITPILLPGEYHGQRSLASYSPWSHKESDTAEVT